MVTMKVRHEDGGHIAGGRLARDRLLRVDQRRSGRCSTASVPTTR
jgi:hypothetical protein